MLRIGVIVLLMISLGIAGGAQACIEMRCPTCPHDEVQTTKAEVEADDCCQKSEHSKPAEHRSSDRPWFKICCSGACAIFVETSATSASESVISAAEIEPIAPASIDVQPTTPPPRHV